MTVSAKTLSSLLGLLYEAAADPQKWPAFLESLTKQVNADLANLVTTRSSSFAEHLHGSIVYTFGLPVEGVALYRNYYGVRDPVIREYRKRRSQGVAINSELVGRDVYYQSEFYNDFAKYYHAEYICFTAIEQNATRSSGLGLSRSSQLGDFDPETLGLIESLVPHLRRAVALNRTLSTFHAQRFTTTSAMNIAAISLDERGLIIAVSGSAEELLRKQDGLISHGRQLSASDPSQNARLQSLIAAAVTAPSGKGWRPSRPMPYGGSMAIARRDGKHSLQLAIFPFHSSELLLEDRPCAIVFLVDPENKTTATAEALQSLYELTPAESRLAELLLAGHNLADCAEQLGNTIETTRDRLKTVMRKTNVSRQSELIRLLIGFPNLRR